MSSVLLLCVIFTCFNGIELVTVQVKQGYLAGAEMVSVLNQTYYSYKGIPYAASPVGSLRFKSPQAPSSWEGVRNATEHASICPQVDVLTNIYYPGSEDCLFLNVYTPTLNANASLPVIFVIHGGGYRSGSGNVDTFGPDFLINYDVIVVTINYRLDSLGFLCLDDVNVPGNAGMKDQVAALKWVNENISVFGGNPNNVTLLGQSAGSASVSYHVLSPLSKGLFIRAISMSGVPYCDWSIPYQPRKRAFALGKMLGNDTRDANELLEFLQSVPVESLINVKATVLYSEELTTNILKEYPFVPVVEKDLGLEHFLTVEPAELLKNGSINQVDILFGHTNEETLTAVPAFESTFIAQYNRYPEMLVPRKILIESPSNVILNVSDLIQQHYFGNNSISNNTMREFVTYSNHAGFFYQILRYFRSLPKIADESRYMYIFSADSGRNVYGEAAATFNITGMGHIDDLSYVFDPKSFNLTLDTDSTEYTIVKLICTLFTNFAKTGNPTPDDTLGVTWPEYDCQNESYANIADTIEIGTSPDSEAVEFWKTIYDVTGMEF